MIALTGTPGTGKTTIAAELSKRYDVLDLNAFIRENGLLEDHDANRDTFNVDTKKLRKKLAHVQGADFCDGHLSHFLDCEMIVVIRCNPSILYERLKRRGYDDTKILENVQAEALDVILCEAIDTGKIVIELDNTDADTNTIISQLEDAVAGDHGRYAPGTVNWGEEMVKWF